MSTLLGDKGISKGSYSSIELTTEQEDNKATLKTVDGMVDLLSPNFDGEQRKSSASVAVFSLLNTILGGGILSLPYAFMKSGALIGILFMGSSIFVSVFSLQLLCKCARKTGSKTYSDVMRKTMGVNTPEIVDALMFLLLKLVLVAFCVLVKSISGDLAEYIFLVPGQILGDPTRNKITTCIFTFFVLPLMTLKTLCPALRLCIVVSVCLLTAVLVYKASQVSEELSSEGRLFPAEPEDLLTAIPIMLAFCVNLTRRGLFRTQGADEGGCGRGDAHHYLFSGGFHDLWYCGYVLAFDASQIIYSIIFLQRSELSGGKGGISVHFNLSATHDRVSCRNLTLLVLGHLKRLPQTDEVAVPLFI